MRVKNILSCKRAMLFRSYATLPPTVRINIDPTVTFCRIIQKDDIKSWYLVDNLFVSDTARRKRIVSGFIT